MDSSHDVDEAYEPRWPLPVMVVLALMGAVLVAAMTLADREPQDRHTRSASAAPEASEAGGSRLVAADPADALRAWDDARSQAWADGDVDGLRELYVQGSAAGDQDAAMLSLWLERGVRVEGLGMQLLAVKELRRTSSRVVLRVTDRVAGGVAVGGGARIRLPVDAASTRVITLQRGEPESWRVSSVRLVS